MTLWTLSSDIHTGTERVSAHDVREVRSNDTAGAGAAKRMAGGAMGKKHRLALSRRVRSRRTCCTDLVRPPHLEVRGRIHGHRFRHVRVLRTAVFGALAAID